MKLSSKSSKAVATKIAQIVPSTILESITIEGDIYGEGALEVDGKIRGDIRCLSLLVSANAIVHGNIVAEKVEIWGEVVGDIVARKIICGSTAKVRGDILHSSIHIENGAYVDGNCRKFVAENIEELVAEAAPQESAELEQVKEVEAEVEAAEMGVANADFSHEDLVYRKTVEEEA